MRRFFTFFSIIVAIAAVGIWSTLHQARANTEEAEAYIQKLGDSVVKIMREQEQNRPKMLSELTSLLDNTIDTDAISRFVVGKYWRRADENQQTLFMNSYGPYLINTYTLRFSEYSGETFDVTSTRVENNGIIMVQSAVVRPRAENVRVDFRLREQQDGSLKVYDVIIEGVSQLQTQRSEFNSIIDRKGIDYLIERLAKRVEQIEKARAS